MENPLWHQVYSRRTGFQEFLNRYSSHLFQEKEILPIFVLALLFHHDEYVENNRHVLIELFTNQVLTERGVKYFYLFWAFGKDLRNTIIVQDCPQFGTFQKYSIKILPEFDSDQILDWIAILMKSLFRIGCVCPELPQYDNSNWSQTFQYLNYDKQMRQQNLILSACSSGKNFYLSQAHLYLKETFDFLLGQKFPSFMKSYREDPTFIRNVVYQYWPDVLKTFEQVRPLNNSEVDMIREAHQKLYQEGDIEFFIQYVSLFQKAFPDHILSSELGAMLKPNPELDAKRARKVLEQISPNERQLYYLPSIAPISDSGMEALLKKIQEQNFEIVFRKLNRRYQKFFREDLEFWEGRLMNEEICSTGESIWAYRPSELVFHTEDDNYFVFTRNELYNMTNSLNPYTRKPLPKKIFEHSSSEESQTYADIWSEILRRKIESSDLI